MPNATVHDPLGIDTGIKISNLRSVLDRKGDRIVITGRMTGDRLVGMDVEPDLQCDIINQQEQICMSVCSTHQGVFAITRKVTFTVQVEEVSRYIEWDDIARISLYVIFRRTG